MHYQLWSINEYITNPHWIYPRNAIQLLRAPLIEPPQIDIISNKEIGYVVINSMGLPKVLW